MDVLLILYDEYARCGCEVSPWLKSFAVTVAKAFRNVRSELSRHKSHAREEGDSESSLITSADIHVEPTSNVPPRLLDEWLVEPIEIRIFALYELENGPLSATAGDAILTTATASESNYERAAAIRATFENLRRMKSATTWSFT